MSPTGGKKGAKTYCYYTTRTSPGKDRENLWRFPTSEIDSVVIEATASHLEKSLAPDSAASNEWKNRNEATP